MGGHVSKNHLWYAHERGQPFICGIDKRYWNVPAERRWAMGFYRFDNRPWAQGISAAGNCLILSVYLGGVNRYSAGARGQHVAVVLSNTLFWNAFPELLTFSELTEGKVNILKILAITRNLGGDKRRQNILHYLSEFAEISILTVKVSFPIKLANYMISYSLN